MTTKLFKKVLISLMIVAFIAMISLTINTLTKSAKAQSGRTEATYNNRLQLQGQLHNLKAICDTVNGTMIYQTEGLGSVSSSSFLVAVPNGCTKK